MTTRTVICKVAGVTYENRQATLAQLRGTEPARIVPEPANPYDPNALAVQVALADGTIAHVGYIPKELAKTIAPHLEGEAVTVRLLEVTGGFELPDGDVAALGLRIEVEFPVSEENALEPPENQRPVSNDL